MKIDVLLLRMINHSPNMSNCEASRFVLHVRTDYMLVALAHLHLTLSDHTVSYIDNVTLLYTGWMMIHPV